MFHLNPNREDSVMSQPQTPESKVPTGQALHLETLLDIVPGSVVSKQLIKGEAGNITLFSFGQGEGLSEHTAPFDAFVQILEGSAELTIGGEKVTATAGQTVVMPANVPHSLHAAQPFKMLLTMIRK